MGKRIARLVVQDNELSLVLGLEATGHPDTGTDLGRILDLPDISCKITDNPKDIKKTDALIDFSAPEATVEHVLACAEFGVPVVIGTTGLSDEQISELKKASKRTALLFSPNMSVGVNLLFHITGLMAERLGPDYEAKIHEVHHVHKKDAPSGTAKKFAEVIEKVKGKKIQVTSERTGEVTGDHTITFEGNEERIEILHSALSRDLFAKGAIKAAKWIMGKPAGFYSMEDVLGLKK